MKHSFRCFVREPYFIAFLLANDFCIMYNNLKYATLIIGENKYIAGVEMVL